MRILIIDHYYPAYLDYLYKKNSDFFYLNYNEQKNAIFNNCFGVANFYSKNLKKLGHVAQEIIYNNEVLQKQWAKEKKLKYSKSYFKNIPKLRTWLKSNWEEKILKAQIEEFSPDIIYCQNLSYPNQNFLQELKKRVKLIIGQVACPIDFDKQKLKAFDIILTSFPHYVDRFKKIGINSEYFKIGFEDSIIKKLKKSEKQNEAVFVGGFSKRHSEAINIFEYLAKNTNLNFWGYGANELSANSIIKQNHRGESWGINMYNILYNSRISINRHIDAAENYANNMRLYESTGVGTMLITDNKNNINELFKVGKEIETYKSKEELLEKINYYLSHEEERDKIAKAGQARTLKDHTYKTRMKELVQILNKYL